MKFKLVAVLASLLLLTSCSSGNNNSVDSSNPSTEPVVSAAPTAFKSCGDLKVHFIDVGQGDSILVQTPGGKTMLVDAGKKEDGIKVVNYIKALGIKKIDALVNTVPDDEHIGGMAEVANSFEISKAYIPKKLVSSSAAQEAFLNAPNIAKLDLSQAQTGVQILIDPTIGIKMFAPGPSTYTDVKDYSAVIKVSYGDNSFLLTGDAPSTSEKEMLSKSYDLKSAVLKVGNHGAATSTTQEFLNAVAPKYAVISAGKGNIAKETLDKLTAANAQILRTDESGTIVATTDGLTIKFDKSAPAKASANSTVKP